MDSAETAHGQDPLVAALPPAMDYITYLTLLEYQLNTQNLPTLNRLLSDDDGTLAAEIGWDLLKLVLPMLQVVPEEASRCFEIVARRGNPREVIVRVAEELDRLGHDDSDDSDSSDEPDALPRFANEAEHIHLGEMQLEGMPEQTARQNRDDNNDDDDDDDDGGASEAASNNAQSGSDDGLSLKALLSMLGVLHPRINTEHPSRFLATSLPAALGAYRRIPITVDTTMAFLSLLSRMSGKQRPALPPRVSTAGSSRSLVVPTTTPSSSSAPLPDPEANSTGTWKPGGPSDNEKAIIQKLLQAVLLEVLDEYASSLLAHDVVHMQWTSRQREKLDPKRVVPGRASITQTWSKDPELEVRDQLMERFWKLAKALDLSAGKELKNAFAPNRKDYESVDDSAVSATDYPQSPADITFPSEGLVLLAAGQMFYDFDSPEPLALPSLLQLLDDTDTWSLTHSAATTDAVLCLIYSAIKQPTVSTARSESVIALNQLTQLFVSSPDPVTRDNAHHIATILVHDYTSYDSKIFYLKSLLQKETSKDGHMSLADIQTGNLKSVAVNWLKEEFMSFASPSSSSSTQQDMVDAGLLASDSNLGDLLFPASPSLPGPFISSHPLLEKDSSASMSTETDLERFILQIPFFISSLNLVTILASFSTERGDTTDEAQSDVNSAGDGILPSPYPRSPNRITFNNSVGDGVPLLTGSLLAKVKKFVATLDECQKGILALLSAERRTDTDGDGDASSSLGDVYAMEDAVRRASDALGQLPDTEADQA